MQVLEQLGTWFTCYLIEHFFIINQKISFSYCAVFRLKAKAFSRISSHRRLCLMYFLLIWNLFALCTLCFVFIWLNFFFKSDSVLFLTYLLGKRDVALHFAMRVLQYCIQKLRMLTELCRLVIIYIITQIQTNPNHSSYKCFVNTRDDTMSFTVFIILEKLLHQHLLH